MLVYQNMFNQMGITVTYWDLPPKISNFSVLFCFMS